MKPVLRDLTEFSGNIWKPDWREHTAQLGVRAVVAITICLTAGVAVGSPDAGALAASGALGAGFGAFERIRGSSLPPMLFACAGMGLSVFVGTLFGYSDIGFALLAGLAALAAGLVVSVSTGLWFVGMQSTIAAMVAANYPEDFASAASRTTLVVCGGLLQTLVVLLLRRLRPAKNAFADEDRLDTEASLLALKAAPEALPAVKRHLAPSSAVWNEAIRLALTVGLTAWLSRFLEMNHGHWAPMTAMLVLKSDLHLTFGRGAARISGTLAGVTLATAITILFAPGPVALCALSVATAWAIYTVLRVNYAIYSIFIAAFIVFQMEILGQTGLTVAKDRVLGTLLGVACALVPHLVWPGKEIRD